MLNLFLFCFQRVNQIYFSIKKIVQIILNRTILFNKQILEMAEDSLSFSLKQNCKLLIYT